MLVKHPVVTVTLDFCWVISMAALFAIRRRRRMQTERVRKNPLAQLTELEIIQNYRLSKAAILELCSLLQHDLQRKKSRVENFDCGRASFNIFESTCLRKFLKFFER